MLGRGIDCHPSEHRRTRLVVVAMLAFGVLSLTTPTSADPFGVGGRDTGWLADNHDHDYCWSDRFTWTSLRNLADDAMDYLETSTDFSGGSRQKCNSGTDIHFRRVVTTLYRGQYACADRDGNVCDKAYIRITSNTNTLPVAERGKTICHEIGHSTGATHHNRGYGCMVSGSSTAETYWLHTRNHMDSLEVETS